MQLSSTLIKTAKGLEEIDKRTYKLSGRLRAVMFMIDGQRSVGALLEQAGSMAEQLETQLKELATQGFIEEIVSAEEGVSQPEPQPPPAPAVAVKPERPISAPTVTPPTVMPATPVQKVSAPPASPSRVREPINVVKERLSKMLAETMGMRAMFITSQLNSLQTYPEIERFIDDTAKANATTSGVKAAEQWRAMARQISGL